MLTEPLPSNVHINHISSSLRLFDPHSLLVYYRSFFSEVSARDVFLWLGFSCGDYSPTDTIAPSLRAFIPSGSLVTFQSIQVHHRHPKFSFPKVGQNYPEWPVLQNFRLLMRYIASRCFGFRGGLPLHNVQFRISRNPLDIPTPRFQISSRRVFLRIFLNTIIRRSSCLRARFFIPFIRSGFE